VFSESVAVPNTPPCILIILIACSWFDRSVAPQQSCNKRHSNLWSLASRIVLCTHTSVVMPVSTRVGDAAQPQHQFEIGGAKRAFAGLVVERFAGKRHELWNDLPARLPTNQYPSAGPGSPIPAPMRRERQRLFAGRSARSGRRPSRV
jgi:hypothetical protein